MCLCSVLYLKLFEPRVAKLIGWSKSLVGLFLVSDDHRLTVSVPRDNASRCSFRSPLHYIRENCTVYFTRSVFSSVSRDRWPSLVVHLSINVRNQVYAGLRSCLRTVFVMQFVESVMVVDSRNRSEMEYDSWIRKNLSTVVIRSTVELWELIPESGLVILVWYSGTPLLLLCS